MCIVYTALKEREALPDMMTLCIALAMLETHIYRNKYLGIQSQASPAQPANDRGFKASSM
jgi:hypothetical protein